MGLVCNLHELLTTIQDVQEQSVIICQTLIDYRLAIMCNFTVLSVRTQWTVLLVAEQFV